MQGIINTLLQIRDVENVINAFQTRRHSNRVHYGFAGLSAWDSPIYLERSLSLWPKRHMPRIGDTWGTQGHQLRPREYNDAYPYNFSVDFER
jgi:hypothetical protein